ncbi:MAG: SigB/SigF/SigG family RNA polymerase sigma factor [Finegoldia sp.]|nr:SigB/SigF/SigG family RNA polymerase sigma factor [Finegoldia sp.]
MTNKKDHTNTDDLFREYAKSQDKDIRDELIERHLYIAEILAKKYVGKGIEYDDLYQVACIGLIYAIERYDIDKGYKFSSFATPTIVGEIKRYFRDKGWIIRVPRRIQETSKKVKVARNQLSQAMQRSPTVKEIADYLKIDQEEVLEAMEGAQVYSTQSLESSFDSQNEDNDSSLEDIIGREDKDMEQFENREIIMTAMKNFNDVEKKILIGRYYEKKTQLAIAKELDISQMTVSRMEKKITKKFKDEIYKQIGDEKI